MKKTMNLRTFKIFGIILLMFAYIGWLSIFIILALYIFGFLTFDISIIWGFITAFSIMPVCAALFQYIFFSYVIGRIRKNIEDLKNIQKFCYSCGEKITTLKKIKTCPKCNANLNISEIMFKI